MTVAPVVHVGYQKTATTWLQDAVFAPSPDMHLVDRQAIIDQLIDPGRFAFDVDEARSKLLPPGSAQATVLSHEWLVGHPFGRGYDTEVITRRLASLLGSFKVLLVIRNQVPMIRAHYGEWVHHGGALSLERFLAPPDDWRWHPDFHWDYFEYDRLIRHYHDQVGADSVLVLCHESLRHDRASFLQRVADFVGVNSLTPQTETAIHPSLGAATLSLHRQANRAVSTWGHNPGAAVVSAGAHARLGRAMRRLDSAVPTSAHDRFRERSDATLHALVGDRYVASNRRTAELTGLDLAGLGYQVSG